MRLIRKLKWLFYITIIALALKGLSTLLENDKGKDSIYVMEIRDTIIFSEPFIRELHTVEKMKDVKAIIIRINSPGGTIGASQEIFREIEKFKEKTKKKIICSIENVGASGAYYISLACDRSIALPGSIVGSIGVISIFFTADELLEEIKIKPFIVKSGSFKDTGTPLRKPTESDIKYLQDIVDDLFRQFKEDIVRKRPHLNEKIESIADGRVFSGKEAYSLGLIDQLGTFSDAVTIAKILADIKEEPHIIWQRKKKLELLEEVLGKNALKELIAKFLQPSFFM